MGGRKETVPLIILMEIMMRASENMQGRYIAEVTELFLVINEETIIV